MLGSLEHFQFILYIQWSNIKERGVTCFQDTFSSLQARTIIFTYEEGASRCNKQCITPCPFIHSVGDIAADLPFTTIEQQLMQKGMSAIVVKWAKETCKDGCNVEWYVHLGYWMKLCLRSFMAADNIRGSSESSAWIKNLCIMAPFPSNGSVGFPVRGIFPHCSGKSTFVRSCWLCGSSGSCGGSMYSIKSWEKSL